MVDLWIAVLPSTRMQEHAGNDKSCVWHAMDFSDGVLKEEMFAIRFGSVESEIFFFYLCLVPMAYIFIVLISICLSFFLSNSSKVTKTQS